MRNISFMLTEKQVMNGMKFITRRLGWKFLKVGDLLQGCRKCQGLRGGEKIKKLRVIRVLDVRFEKLNKIDQADCIAEGFPEMSPDEFVEMFTREMKCTADRVITRIKYEYVN